ncbi:MAG: hypothetical protein H0W02_01935 [Ktedonobacteraceae bacterium]|nr:hypothetical protein [Ktedonobacteraceae bacterium]
MALHIVSDSEPFGQTDHQDAFLEAYRVGILNYLHTSRMVPLTTLDIDHFIERTISDSAHPRAWNAGYLAGWIGGLIAVEGLRISALIEAHHLKSQDTGLHLVEGHRS